MVTKPKTKAAVKEVIGTPGTLDVPEPLPELISEPSQVARVIDIRHVFRVVSPTGEFIQGENVHPAVVIEDHLNQTYFSQGYTLYSVEHLRTNFGKDGEVMGEQMLYILVKYAQ
jgi:hypothetical protein